MTRTNPVREQTNLSVKSAVKTMIDLPYSPILYER